MNKNTSTNYGPISKFFHWSMALIMIGLVLVGFYMSDLSYSPFKMDLYYFHKSFGLLILWMVGLRLIWKHLTTTPEKIKTHAKWEKLLAAFAHILLYVSMIGMPLSGWVMSSAGGHPVSFFGIDMPTLIDKNKEIGGIAHNVHEYLGYVLTAAIALHAIGALKHHFMDKDETLVRMMANPMRKIGPYVLALITLAFIFIVGGLLVKNKTNLLADAPVVIDSE